MKILQVYYEPLLSGQTVHVRSLSKGLAARGHSVSVVFPANFRALTDEFTESGIRVLPLPMRKVLWPIKSIQTLMMLLRREKFEIIHIHSQEAGVIGRLLSYVNNAHRIFYTPQTIDIRHSQWHNIYILLERTLARITRCIFSVNEADAKRMVNWGIPAEKIHVVPNGIEMNAFEHTPDKTMVCERLGLKPADPVVMQIGRLSPQKDPEMFITAAMTVIQKNPKVQFVWIGEGPLYNQVAAKVKVSGLKANVHLPGRLEQAYQYLGAADMVTSTSRWEGLPYSILEAMACSKPVISTNVNGCAEEVIAGKTGYLIQPGDASSLARYILKLIAEPEVAQLMGAEARRWVEEKYSLGQMVTAIETAYIEN